MKKLLLLLALVSVVGIGLVSAGGPPPPAAGGSTEDQFRAAIMQTTELARQFNALDDRILRLLSDRAKQIESLKKQSAEVAKHESDKAAMLQSLNAANKALMDSYSLLNKTLTTP